MSPPDNPPHRDLWPEHTKELRAGTNSNCGSSPKAARPASRKRLLGATFGLVAQ